MQPLTERQKRYIRNVKGIRQPFSLDAPIPAIKKVREFNAPLSENFKPRGFGRRGVGMSEAKRAMVNLRAAKRAAFFESLGTRE